MNDLFSAYPALLHCGIYRPVIDSLPNELTALEQGLLAAVPPPELLQEHCSNHLVSFARHIQDVVADPIRRVEVGSSSRCLRSWRFHTSWRVPTMPPQFLYGLPGTLPTWSPWRWSKCPHLCPRSTSQCSGTSGFITILPMSGSAKRW